MAGGARDVPLSLGDLEQEFEAAMRRLQRSSERASRGRAGEGEDGGHDEEEDYYNVSKFEQVDDFENLLENKLDNLRNKPGQRRSSMKQFLAERGREEAKLSQELAASEALDDQLTQEALMAELKGIQFEMDEYARIRGARRRLARSLPPSEKRSEVHQAHGSESYMEASLARSTSGASSTQKFRSATKGASKVSSSKASKSRPTSKSASIVTSKFAPKLKSKLTSKSKTSWTATRDNIEEAEEVGEAESAAEELDAAMQRAMRMSHEHELEQRDALIMQEMFEHENANLEAILRTHYERSGMRHLEALGKELSQRRQRELTALRAELEDENEDLLREMREEFEVRLDKEKAAVKKEYVAKREELHVELKKEFSHTALEQEVENTRLQWEHRIGEEIAQARRDEEAKQRALLDRACADALAAKETDLMRAREVVQRDFVQRREETLRDLELALQEGARESHKALVAQLELKLESEMAQRQAYWEDRRAATMGSLKTKQEVLLATKLSEIDTQLETALDKAVLELQRVAEETLSREIREKTESARLRQQSVIANTRAELERKHEQSLAELVANHKRELEAADADYRSKTLSALQDLLESKRQYLQNELDQHVNSMENHYQQMLADAKSAFEVFCQRAKQFQSDKFEDKEEDYQGTTTNDEGESDGNDDEEHIPAKWKIPSRLNGSDAGERMVLKLLSNLADGHHELAERLRQANRKVSKLGKELVQMRQTKATDLADTKRQLHDARQTIQKLFQANHNLTTTGLEDETS